jgi:hypothetical protein
MFTSCKQKSSLEKVNVEAKLSETEKIYDVFQKWTDSIRSMVINEVTHYPTDSVQKQKEGENYINYFHYYKGKKIKAFALTVDNKDTVSYYYKSIKTNYEANGENCPEANKHLIKKGGLHTYAGLKYKEKHMGIATYLQCDGSAYEMGLYYANQKIGIWKTINSKGKIIDEQNFGDTEKLKNFITNN